MQDIVEVDSHLIIMPSIKLPHKYLNYHIIKRQPQILRWREYQAFFIQQKKISDILKLSRPKS